MSSDDLYFEDYSVYKLNKDSKLITGNLKIFKGIHDLWLYTYNKLNEYPLPVNYALMLGIDNKVKEISNEYVNLINETMINIYYKLCHNKIEKDEINELVIKVIKSVCSKVEKFENLLLQDMNVVNTIRDIYDFKNKYKNEIITKKSLINLIYIIFDCILNNDEIDFDDLIYKMEDEHVFINLSHDEINKLIDEFNV